MLSRKGYRRLVLLLAGALAVAFFAALFMGRYSFDPRDTFQAFMGRLSGQPINQTMENVVFVVRLPRILAALLVGAALAVSGAVYQSTFRNPLVSPDILGVSSGASTGAAIGIILGMNFGALQLFAFSGGIAAVALTTSLARALRSSSNMMLVLSGIIVSGLMTSILGILKFVAEDQVELSSIVFWQMGSLASVKQGQLLSVVGPIVLALILMIALAWRLNILSFGEQEAKTVGVNVPVLRGVMIVFASLLTASAVSISGTIGWIGLVIPHFGRLLAGSDNTRLLPVVAILGGMFLLIVDTIARTLTMMEIPLSILTGLVGAPFFAWLLYRQRGKLG